MFGFRRPSSQIKSPPAVEGERAKLPSVVPPQFLQKNLEALGSLYRAARAGLLEGDHTGSPFLRRTHERRSAVVAEGACSRWPSLSISVGRLLFSVTVSY